LSAVEARTAGVVRVVTTDVEDGRLVTVALNGQSYTGVVSGNNASVAIPASALQELTSGQNYSLTANVSDAAGNALTATASTSTSFAVNTSVPTITIAANVAGDNRVNASEDDALVISGTAVGANGSTINVALTDGITVVNTTATVSTGGAWSATAANISALRNGAITVTADVSDASGNAAVAATRTLQLDNVLPSASIVIDSVTSDNVLNLAEGAAATVTITGTVGGEVAVGDTVTVTVNNVSETGTVSQSGSAKVFSINVTGANLLADTDRTVDARVITTDAAGNSVTATATRVYTLDQVAPTIATVTADWGPVLSAVEARTAGVVRVVTTDVEDGRLVTVALNGQS
ncbi:MAG: Ig-like domain-containing protein, partial [Burkholderiaceae bacterium]|nr:Ig-like domain-containing protein [Burkholderiaceae bacterium]